MSDNFNQKHTNNTPDRDEEMVMPEQASKIHHSHLGAILGVLVVVLVLIFIGLYLWGSTLSEQETADVTPRQIENNEPETPRSEADAQIMETVSPSDTIEAIEADLESTNLDELEAGLDEIDEELESSSQN